MAYKDLRAINVNERTEKKNGLTYLSWAWAVDVLLQQDPTATWEYMEPKQWGESWMVFCKVTAFGKSMTAQLPVIDHRNKAITGPDAMQVNTAMQRCLAKAIALHGIGLYIYAGEDLPEQVTSQADIDAANNLCNIVLNDELEEAECGRQLRAEWEKLDNEHKIIVWGLIKEKNIILPNTKKIMTTVIKEYLYQKEQAA